MARRIFFSFHYQRDLWRVNVVRKSNVVREEGTSTSFHDSSLWEEAERKGDAAIKRMIDQGLEGTTVTCVLIGAETSTRPYVQYEIEKSKEIGNGVLGVRIHNVEDRNGRRDYAGDSPFSLVDRLFGDIQVFDWVTDGGYDNFGRWAEAAYETSAKAKRTRELQRRISGKIW
jgi:MTH538 TIR-like domain (DUF1863)